MANKKLTDRIIAIAVEAKTKVGATSKPETAGNEKIDLRERMKSKGNFALDLGGGFSDIEPSDMSSPYKGPK